MSTPTPKRLAEAEYLSSFELLEALANRRAAAIHRADAVLRASLRDPSVGATGARRYVELALRELSQTD